MSSRAKTWSAAASVAILLLVSGCYDFATIFGTAEDGTPVAFVVPPDGATIGSPVTLAVTGAGVTRATFEVDGATEFDDSAPPFEWTLDPADHAGERVITVTGYEGDVEYSVSVTLTLDVAAGGDVQFVTPADRAVITAPVTLSVLGATVTSATFRLDGAQVLDDRTAPFQWRLDPATVYEGDHLIRIDAFLPGGSRSHEVSIRTQKPAGEPAPPSETLTAIQNLKPRQWYEIPNSKLESVAPVPLPEGSLSGVIGAWSGGAYDTKRDRLIVWGGGHGDYSGNEIYTFSMRTFVWKRVTDPSAFPPGDPDNDAGLGAHPDGAPISRHTYDYIEYIPAVDRFFCGGGAGIWRGGQIGDDTTYMFNFDTLEWTQHDDTPSSTIGSTTAVGPDGRVWMHGARSDQAVLAAFDGATGTWTRYARYGAWIGYDRTAEIDPVENKYVLIGVGEVRVWDLDSPNSQHIVVSTKGASPGSLKAPGVAYDPVTRELVVWGGGSTVHSYDVATATWTSHATTGVNTSPPSAVSTGTYGRWRYVPSLNAFVVVNSVKGNVFVYKHS